MGSGYSLAGVVQFRSHGAKWFTRAGYETNARAWPAGELDVDLRGRIVLVTGGNAGLGYETALALAQRHATVHIVCRNAERGERALAEIRRAAANDDVHLHLCDVSEFAAVRRFAGDFVQRVPHLDVLVNNAGVLLNTRSETSEGVETSLATMLGGTFLLTGLLLPVLKAAPQRARVINVSSGGMYTVAVNLKDLQGRKSYDGSRQYSVAKRAQVDLSAMWAQRLAAHNIFVCSMHPGWAATPGVETSLPKFFKQMGDNLRTAQQGADTIVWLAAAANAVNAAPSGSFFFDRAAVRTSFRFAGTESSAAVRAALWAACVELTQWDLDEATAFAKPIAAAL